MSEQKSGSSASARSGSAAALPRRPWSSRCPRGSISRRAARTRRARSCRRSGIARRRTRPTDVKLGSPAGAIARRSSRPGGAVDAGSAGACRQQRSGATPARHCGRQPHGKAAPTAATQGVSGTPAAQAAGSAGDRKACRSAAATQARAGRKRPDRAATDAARNAGDRSGSNAAAQGRRCRAGNAAARIGRNRGVNAGSAQLGRCTQPRHAGGRKPSRTRRRKSAYRTRQRKCRSQAAAARRRVASQQATSAQSGSSSPPKQQARNRRPQRRRFAFVRPTRMLRRPLRLGERACVPSRPVPAVGAVSDRGRGRREPARHVVRRDEGPQAHLLRSLGYLVPHAVRTFTNSLAVAAPDVRLGAVRADDGPAPGLRRLRQRRTRTPRRATRLVFDVAPLSHAFETYPGQPSACTR